MLHELRTTYRGGGARDVQKALSGEKVYGVFQTEIGETGRTVIIRPQESLDLHGPPVVRGEGRRDARGADLFGKHELELLTPAPFMRPLEQCALGHVWELRWYDYPAGTSGQALEAFGRAMPHREEAYSVIGCWTEAIGPHGDRLYLLSPFKDWDHYDEIGSVLQQDPTWPPETTVAAKSGGAKVLIPVAYSMLR